MGEGRRADGDAEGWPEVHAYQGQETTCPPTDD